MCSEEETHLALQVVKSREVQRELSAAEVRSKLQSFSLFNALLSPKQALPCLQPAVST